MVELKAVGPGVPYYGTLELEAGAVYSTLGHATLPSVASLEGSAVSPLPAHALESLMSRYPRLGRNLAGILAELGHVAEGVPAARAARSLAARHGIDMPIAEAVDRVLHEGLPVRDAVAELLRREPRPETA